MLLLLSQFSLGLSQIDTTGWKQYSDSTFDISFKYPPKYVLRKSVHPIGGCLLSLSLSYQHFDTSHGNPYDLSPERDTATQFIERWINDIRFFTDTSNFEYVADREGFADTSDQDSSDIHESSRHTWLGGPKWEIVERLHLADHNSNLGKLYELWNERMLACFDYPNAGCRIYGVMNAEEWGNEDPVFKRILWTFSTRESRHADSISQANEQRWKPATSADSTWKAFSPLSYPISFRYPPKFEIRRDKERHYDWVLGYQTNLYKSSGTYDEAADTGIERNDTSVIFCEIVGIRVSNESFYKIARGEGFGIPGGADDLGDRDEKQIKSWVLFGRQDIEGEATQIELGPWKGLKGVSETGVFSRRGYAGLGEFSVWFLTQDISDTEKIEFCYHRDAHDLDQRMELEPEDVFNDDSFTTIIGTLRIKTEAGSHQKR